MKVWTDYDAKIAERFEDIKKRENQIPGEIADLTINVNNVSRSLEDAESEFRSLIAPPPFIRFRLQRYK